ncbi:recombination protein Rad52 [Rhodotorula toruloides]
MSDEAQERHAKMQAMLNKSLGPEHITNRPGGGGTKLSYLEGWRAINIANEVFGYNGWFTDIKYLEADFIDYNPETARYNMGVTAIVRVRLQDGASHEDVGYGKLENAKSKADGLDKCKKEAVTDALKRALRHFGKLLGNCLYDKSYLQTMANMKAPKVSSGTSCWSSQRT